MKDQLIILDFDGTIFNSALFYQDMRNTLEITFGINAATFKSNQKRFMLASDHSYDFFAHVRDLGLDKSEVSALLREKLGPTDYLYPDVLSFLKKHQSLQTEILVVTVGVDDWQNFKLSFCPAINHLTQHVLHVHKGAHLASQHMHREGKRLSFDLVEPDSFKEI